MLCTVLNNMWKYRASMNISKANRFLHISPFFLLPAQLFKVAGHTKVTKFETQLIHILCVSLERRDVSTPILRSKISRYYRYVHTWHTYTHTRTHTDMQTYRQTYRHIYIYNIITIHYIETYRHKNIQMCYICSVPFFVGRFQEDITQNLYTLILLLSCALGLKAT